MKIRYVLLSLVCMFVLTGARPMLRGFPVCKVYEVDRENNTVYVDIGTNDGVFKGMTFSVVGKGGRQEALITIRDSSYDRSWSEKLAPASLDHVAVGMDARLVSTPEVSMLLSARQKDTSEAYRDFISNFPDSRFLPELVRLLPDDRLREVEPDYYAAWKTYTLEAFKGYIDKHPASGFARLAVAEIKNIEVDEAEQAKLRKARADKAAAYEEERKRREELEEKMKAMSDMSQGKELLGKLTNNSGSPMRFEFQPPSNLASITVPANSSSDVRHPSGSYGYKVYEVEENPAPFDPAAPPPVKEGAVDIETDFWELSYP